MLVEESSMKITREEMACKANVKHRFPHSSQRRLNPAICLMKKNGNGMHSIPTATRQRK